MQRAGLMASILWLATLSAAHAATDAKRETFGTTPDGKRVDAVVLSNTHGTKARILALGASLQSLEVADRNGKSANIALGYASLDGYLSKPQYFGTHGFDKVLWTVGEVKHDGGKASVTLTYVSPDGDMGYPGELKVSATYTLDEDNRLSIDYRATTDKTTIVNLSNHAYWNLSGEGSGSVMDERLTIAGDAYLPVDAGSIPTGQIRKVDGTPFDFRQAKPIGRDIRTNDPQLLNGRGYDHNWVISRDEASAPRMVARVEDPASGRVMTLKSAKPGLQFYSGNFLDGTTVGTGGHVYRQGDAFVLEPQLYPDTPNQASFGSARLEPGHEYRNLIVYEFTTESARGAR
jgi:aldose 1-epimerase